MPLIILTGFPCSGLTHRATQLATALEEAQSQLIASSVDPSTPSTATLKSKYKIHVVSTHDNVNYPRTVYDTARTEKEARGLAYTRAKRMLGRDSFVILDGMNYIKGYRYQLWCEAKALGTSCCVVHVGTPIDQCVANNEARIKRKNASQPQSSESESKDESKAENQTESEPLTDEQPPPNPLVEDTTDSDPYPPAVLQNLIFRYEEPSMHSRWDKPLFTVPWSDAEPPIADIWTALTGLPHPSTLTTEASEDADTVLSLTEALTSSTLSSAASTTSAFTKTTNRPGGISRPSGRLVIKPHKATQLPASANAGSSALYSMEKHTSAIVSAIRSFTLANPSAKATLASNSNSNSNLNSSQGISIPVPHTETPIFIPSHIVLGSVTDDLSSAGGILALPRLQRLRRQWITLNRVYIAGPHASSKGGGLKEEEVGGAFVRFLNADFGDEDLAESEY
ncbi:chromatin associated protein KTI12 [Aspergillus crustosus]